MRLWNGWPPRAMLALIEFAKKFDGAKLTAKTLRVNESELATAGQAVNAKLKRAIRFAHRNISQFHKQGLRKGWNGRNAQGAKVGEKFDPFGRVGVYIPGGTAPLMSTALMTVTLAKVAGCREIVVCTPCGKDGSVNPGLLHAAKVAGATEVYRVGGAHAIAAMAHGTKTIAPVQKIFGPGNAYVVAAKRLWWAMCRSTCCLAQVRCSCWRMKPPIRPLLLRISWRRLSMVPVTNAAGW